MHRTYSVKNSNTTPKNITNRSLRNYMSASLGFENGTFFPTEYCG